MKLQMSDKELPLAYACYNKNRTIRDLSTSGGVFTLIANYVFSKGGVVFGAAFDESFNVHHIFSENEDGLSGMRGSKYPQSFIGNAFKKAKNFLDEGRLVLFTGLPCQIYGLVSYLGDKPKNLLLIDLICQGVASDGLWREYIGYLKKKGNIDRIVFKNKDRGWEKWYFRVYYKSGKMIEKRGFMTMYMGSYLDHANIRPSCYFCRFKGFARISDFSIADCWGIGSRNKEINDGAGLSALLIHSEKGAEVFDAINDSLAYVQYDPETLMSENYSVTKCAVPSKNRTDFFNDYRKAGGMHALKKFYKPGLKKRICYQISKIRGIEK